MGVVKARPKAGDPCPQCGGALVPARQLSDEERARLTDRENPGHFGPNTDRGTKDQIAELGPLATCATCGYQTRFEPAADQGDGDTKRTRKPKSDDPTA